MQIGYDAKRYFHNRTGLGNYSRNIVNGVKRLYPECKYILYDRKTLKRVLQLGGIAEKDGCDIYHGLSNELPFHIKGKKVRSVVTTHDVAWRRFTDMYHRIDRMMYDVKYGWAARNADHVIAISQSTKEDVIYYYNVPEERIPVLYQPVENIFYTPLDKDLAQGLRMEALPAIPSNYLLSVGSVNSRKNLLRTLEAMSTIPAGQRLPLIIVGNGKEYLKVCREFCSKHLRPADTIWLTNIKDNRTLQALYAGATAMLYPSMYEGFGLPVAEALLQGCPVLTSTVSSLPEAAGPGGLTVNPSDVEAIATGISRLTEDEGLRTRLATQGEKYCRENLDPDIQTRKLMEIYRKLE